MLTLQELSDRAEIGDIVARLGYTQDDRDFDGLAALFADRIGFDMSAAGGDPPPTSPATNSPAWPARFCRVSPPPGTAPVTC